MKLRLREFRGHPQAPLLADPLAIAWFHLSGIKAGLVGPVCFVMPV